MDLYAMQSKKEQQTIENHLSIRYTVESIQLYNIQDFIFADAWENWHSIIYTISSGQVSVLA